MFAWAVVKNGAPLERIEIADRAPVGSEVTLEVTHCGVCHSDLHFWKGEYDLGGGKIMRLTDRGVTLPQACGHEVAGRVVALGPEAEGVAIGDTRIVYPWIGCGECPRCLAEEDNLCERQASVGVVRSGGFGEKVTVPHPRYLVDPGNVDPALAATYACSGITVYGAAQAILPLPPEAPVVLIGAGGLGLAAIEMLKALGHRNIISVDTSAEKRAAALEAGASAVVDGTAADVAAAIEQAASGKVEAVIDFVNAAGTVAPALDALSKGGKLVLIGVAGGEIPLSLAGMIFRARTIIGRNTGSVKDLRAVVEMANQGLLKPTPIRRMPKSAANEAMTLLHDGKVTGRIVLEGRP